MGQKKFTQDEQRAIRDNPYVERVSETTITYTKEFKERFALEYAQGKPPSVILRACGFDPAMLGKKRRDGLVSKTREYAQRPEGFNDTRKEKSGRRKIEKELTDTEKIQRLEHQVRYLKQENDFLKKIKFLDRQAEWECKRKRNRKKSIESSKK